jgi:uncharacterized protein involved in exopolysaccharide biosynthesis
MNRRSSLIPAVVFIVLGIALGGYGGLQLRQAASRYQATASVRVIRGEADLAKLPAAASDAIFQQNESEVSRSETVLTKVVVKLDLARAWGQARGGEPLLTAEAVAELRKRVSVVEQPGSALLQIAAIAETPAQAQTLANTWAAAFCEARLERRQQAAREVMDSLAAPFQENEAKFQRAAERVAKARATLDPAVRHLESPPLPTESVKLRELRQESTRMTMIVMVQSNQLARSQSLPTADLQKLTDQFTRTTNHVNELETAIQAELQKQDALKNFWDAQQEVEQINIVLAPLQQAMIEQRTLAVATNNPPAVVAEPADSARNCPPAIRSP